VRLLAIAHNCVGVSNRRKFDALATDPDLDITLVTPPWWFEEGRVQRPLVGGASNPGYRVVVGRTVFINNGTRHAYVSHLAGLIGRWRPDVIDVHEEPFSAAAFQATVLRDVFAPEAALIFCSYVNLERVWRRPYAWLERYVLKRADAAYAPNSDVPGVLQAKGFRGPVAVIPMGVDLEQFHPTNADLRRRAASSAPWKVGFLGRLEPVKGLPVLLDAFALLNQEAQLVVAGDGPEQPSLETRAWRLGVGDRVQFRPALAFSEVPSFLRTLDVLVLPSITIPPAHREQFGRVLVEAMACGIPVIGSSSGGIPEVIGDAGLIVPEGDAAALAGALAQLLNSDALQRELAGRGLHRANNVFAWPRVAQEYRNLYGHARELRAAGRGRTSPLAQRSADG
jgi:glycosyltransferase involved in cell wall biosynthesis